MNTQMNTHLFRAIAAGRISIARRKRRLATIPAGAAQAPGAHRHGAQA
ncbi:hypothetical protein [Cupriavidus basilensis]|uniref:Uncharacterized protein n=1 Tax=Cupriavidus basilensis TaxID=68895 RepID=A0A7M2H708_9BURK|nr:hypothetical protein [Cupriavidus basilensis]MCP3019547.1 hypothetical protein [Cupriavidus basilensis]QOT80730.1 hypothetical protein F7R26_025250 [Cupriavidus basilensis]